MKNLHIKYRTWYKVVPPKQIKLKIPGWSGEQNEHKTGDKPMPWHCIPFVESSTYGLELCYPFESECRVYLDEKGEVKFDGDFSKDIADCSDNSISFPPFSSFAPGHFGMTSALDIQAPEDYVLRTEPHPRFYVDTVGDVPCCISGHLQTQWWSKIFFVVFKNPLPGQTLIFRKNEPYGQIIFVPKKVKYDIQEMTLKEKIERQELTNKITNLSKNYINNKWIDHKGNSFDDKYKVLSKIYQEQGIEGINKFLDSVKGSKIKIKGRLFK